MINIQFFSVDNGMSQVSILNEFVLRQVVSEDSGCFIYIIVFVLSVSSNNKCVRESYWEGLEF